MSEVNEYLQCSFKENTIEKNFYWSIGSDNKIHRWVSGEPNSVINSLVMNDEKNIAWNEIGNPMGIFVLDKKTMRQSGTLLSSENKILDRWVSECSYLKEDQFLKIQLD
jgi:hypothetical protein|tara:strand:- start:222 stop:548 length:327 start_codon:yes stop_codon:yes gene_type:complete